MFYTDEPARDYDGYCAHQDRELKKLPQCSYCGEPIQDEKCYVIDGDCICKDCLVLNFERDTDDFIE